MGWELDDVEKPFVAQLVDMGWAHTAGSLDNCWLRCARAGYQVEALGRLEGEWQGQVRSVAERFLPVASFWALLLVPEHASFLSAFAREPLPSPA